MDPSFEWKRAGGHKSAKNPEGLIGQGDLFVEPDGAVFVAVPDDHYAGKLSPADALALAKAILERHHVGDARSAELRALYDNLAATQARCTALLGVARELGRAVREAHDALCAASQWDIPHQAECHSETFSQVAVEVEQAIDAAHDPLKELVNRALMPETDLDRALRDILLT